MIGLEQVSFGFGEKQETISQVSATVARGECVLLCGASGCGKTTVTKLINGLIPILILEALELLYSGLMLKSSLFSRLISGTPIVVVSKGKLDQKALKKLRLTSEDLMESLRMQNVFDLQEIEYAIAETNGSDELADAQSKVDAAMSTLATASEHTGKATA